MRIKLTVSITLSMYSKDQLLSSVRLSNSLIQTADSSKMLGIKLSRAKTSENCFIPSWQWKMNLLKVQNLIRC